MNWLKRKLQNWLEIPKEHRTIGYLNVETTETQVPIQILPSRLDREQMLKELGQETTDPAEWRKLTT